MKTLNDSNADFRPLAVEPLPWRTYLRFFVLCVVLWLVGAWEFSGRYVTWRSEDYLNDAQQKIEKDIADVATGLERNLSIFHGVPAIISRDDAIRRALLHSPLSERSRALDRLPRQSELIKNSELNALSFSLSQVLKNLRSFSVVWVMDADVYCIAASNSVFEGGFVGVNYIDLEYLKEAKEGREGRQFAVGRVTGIPGLFFSAPVFAGLKFVGVVAVKINLPHLSSWVNQANAFITDKYDFIIQAQDKRMELHALPSARIDRLSISERMGRYHQSALPKISIKPWDDSKKI